MIGLFITARNGASRLPGKVLADVCGRPILSLLIERVQTAAGVDRVVLCTTVDPSDEPIVALSLAAGIEVFRGSFEDVLVRYQGAARAHGIRHIVVADGDDPFCEPTMITRVAEVLASGDADFVQIKGMPYGTFPYGMTTAALDEVVAIKDESETEGWGRYFTQTGRFRVHTIEAPERWARPEFRMTLDYDEDLQFTRTIYERLYRGRPLDLDEVFALMDAEPAIPEINGWRQEEYLQRFKTKYSHVKLKGN